MVVIEKMIRATPQVGVVPYRQVHAHSTGNPRSTAQNEADYMNSKNLETGFYTHVVGNGRIIQVAETNKGSWDVGGSWNNESYASVELIESHKTKEDFTKDYKIYVNILRDLAKQGDIPVTLDTSELAGIKTHEYCTYNQPNNASDHIDPYKYLARWGITRSQFKKDVESGFEVSDEKIIEMAGEKKMKIKFKDDKTKTTWGLIDGRLIPFAEGIHSKINWDIDWGTISYRQLQLIVKGNLLSKEEEAAIKK